jgi:hypothetical protein
LANIESRRISVNDAQCRETVPEIIDQAIILFDEGSMRGSLERELGERSQSGPDFQPWFSRLESELVNGPLCEVLIV